MTIMTGHQQVQQSQRISKSKQKNKVENQRQQELAPAPPTINVDELAREKVDEVERSLKQLTSFKLDAFNSWFSILKQIISAADLHRTNDSRDKENEAQTSKHETDDSIYADYGDDNERFTAQVDLSEQFATNSVKWTIRVQAFKIVHRLVQLLSNNNPAPGTSGGKLSPILERYLPDLVRLSFVAATSPYDELKMQGFDMFKFLIERFATVEEKEFPGHSILEQYKTQVLSAVKPAFNLDAPPYITAVASQICSLWICQGLEKEFSDIKRTYQLMMLSIEKLEGQSVNQHSKLYTESELEQERVDILGSWAQLYVASLENDLLPTHHGGRLSNLSKDECAKLKQLVSPQLESLVEKWCEALKDYALLIMPAPRIIGTSHDDEHVYTREVALRLFSPTWPKLVLALSIFVNYEDFETKSNMVNGAANDSSQESTDSDSSPIKRVSKTKYCKFLSGVLMKELPKCLISTCGTTQVAPRTCITLANSTVLALRSLHLLLSNPETSSVFANNLTVAQEFYTTLYGITVAHGRDETNRLLLNETLDLLYGITLKKIVSHRTSVHYAIAKLVSSLMSAMKNIEIARRQKSLIDADIHKRHLAIRRRNLLTLIKTAPQLALDEAPLQEALIAVFQEMLRFDQEPSVGLCLTDQLKTLYPAITCQEHRDHIIEEIFPDLCKQFEDMLSAQFARETTNGTPDKMKQSHIETFLVASRAAINSSSAIQRSSLIGIYMESILRSLKSLIDKKVDLVAIENKPRKELMDYCIVQLTEVQKAFPDEFKIDSMGNEIKLLYELAIKMQQDVKDQINSKNVKLQESKKSTNAKLQSNRIPTAKITLKADFSNFYAKKA